MIVQKAGQLAARLHSLLSGCCPCVGFPLQVHRILGRDMPLRAGSRDLCLRLSLPLADTGLSATRRAHQYLPLLRFFAVAITAFLAELLLLATVMTRALAFLLAGFNRDLAIVLLRFNKR